MRAAASRTVTIAAAPAPSLRLVDRIRLRNITAIKPNPRNSRTHSPDQIATIVASIRRFGFTMPVMIDGAGMLIAGHGRVLAAQQLGMTKVPTIDGSYLSEEERRAYVIADNQIALTADWDLDMLQSELGELDLSGFDLGVLGFADNELTGYLAPPPAAGGKESANPKDGAGTPVVQYNIVFDDDSQQQLWFGLLRKLKLQHPEIETIGGRLAAFIEGLDG